MIGKAETALDAFFPEEINDCAGKHLDLQIGPRRLAFTTRALAILAILLTVAVGLMAMERSVISSAQPKPPLPKIVTGAPVIGATASPETISPNEITVIDGDMIRARGRTVRLVGSIPPSRARLRNATESVKLADAPPRTWAVSLREAAWSFGLYGAHVGPAPRAHHSATTAEPAESCDRTAAMSPAS